MFISQWILTQKEYSEINGYDNYNIHKEVCSIFDDGVKFDLSINENGNAVIIIQSSTEPKSEPLFGQFRTKEVNNTYKVGTNVRVLVNLNAVKQVQIEGKKNSKKIPVVGEENVKSWIKSREEQFGIIVNSVNVGNTQHDWCKKNNSEIKCSWHKVEIFCTVTNELNFNKIVLEGIGSQRSFGYGMIKVFKV